VLSATKCYYKSEVIKPLSGPAERKARVGKRIDWAGTVSRHKVRDLAVYMTPESAISMRRLEPTSPNPSSTMRRSDGA
jgi:hypothetical protein